MKLTSPRAQMLTPDMWRVVRIITVSKMVGGRPFTADIYYERSIIPQYPVTTVVDKYGFGLSKCTCVKDDIDKFLFDAIGSLYQIDAEIEEVVMFDIERNSVNKYLSGSPIVNNYIKFTPVIDRSKQFCNYDIFQFELPAVVRCLPDDQFAISLFDGNTKNIPYMIDEQEKVLKLVTALQEKIK